MNTRPKWLTVKAPGVKVMQEMQQILSNLSLQTVCQNAECPNIGECFNNKTATFMILGNICTRRCSFCAVAKGIPGELDFKEPEHVALAVKKLDLKHAVITSVTRDDLSDGGADHFAKVINSIRKVNPNTSIEVLIPDFKGDMSALKKVIDAKPDIVNHNVETVPRLYRKVRPGADYKRSIKLLERIKRLSPKIYTKSGMMVGLGESEQEIIQTFKDLTNVGCDILTIGQYLRPSKNHIKVHEYVTPKKFEYFKNVAESMGFKYVASGPLVRSSYKAYDSLKILKF